MRLSAPLLALVAAALVVGSGVHASSAATAPASLGTGLVSTADAVPLIRAWNAEVERAMSQDLPEMEAGIGPGSALSISIPGDGTYLCTANFVWTDDAGRLYLGTAGHCVLPESASATHGPGADYDASGVQVSVRTTACPVGTLCSGFTPLGPVVYARYTDVGYDFALVRIPDNLRGEVRHELPAWGGPNGEGTLGAGQTALYFGHGVGIGAGAAGFGLAGLGTAFPTRGRVGTGIGGVAYWQAVGAIQGGDSGAAVVSGNTALEGADAIGILTHGLVASPSPVMMGTHVRTAKELVGAHTGLRIWTLPGGAPLPGLDPPAGEDTNETLPDGVVLLQITNNETTTSTRTYSWTNTWDDVRVFASMQTAAGTAALQIVDAANETLIEATSEANVSIDRTLNSTSLGTWSIHVAFDAHEGAFALRIEEAEAEPGTTPPGSGNGNGSSPPPPTTSPDDGGPAPVDDADSNELPAPGLGVLLVALAFAIRLRSRTTLELRSRGR